MVGGVDHEEVLHVQDGVVGHPGGGVVDEADEASHLMFLKHSLRGEKGLVTN